MQAKLTLSIDPQLLPQIKKFAKKNRTSLSQLVEQYFALLVQAQQQTRPNDRAPVTHSLSGSLKGLGKISEIESVTDYLIEKYS